MIEVTRIDSNHCILHDGLDILVCETENGDTVLTQIKESLANAISKVITSFQIAMTMKKNYASKPVKQCYEIDDPEATLDTMACAILDLSKTVRFDRAKLFVSSKFGSLSISGNTLIALRDVLKDAGADIDPTYGLYTDIKFVIEPPDVKVMEDKVVYILAVPYKDYEVDTCFMVTRDESGATRNIFNTETGELTPIAYGDPMDKDTYPAFDEENVVSGSVGDADTNTAELAGQNITDPVTITASDNVNVVNTELTNGSMRITIS